MEYKIKKKIIFIVSEMNIGGAEKFLVSLVNTLDIIFFDLIVISLSDKNPLRSELNDYIRFFALTKHSKFDRKLLFTLRKILKQENPDIIFNVGAYPFFIVNLALLFKKHSNQIISYHTTIHVNRKQDYLHRLYFSVLKKKDRIITVSKNQEIYTANRYNIEKKIFTNIHNGIDINKWKLPPSDFDRSILRKNLDLPDESKVIVITARLRPEKNHLEAVKALKILHDVYKVKPYLLIVGDGAMLKQIENLVEELNLVEYIKFVGNQKDVRPFYWISDLFSLCSNSVETFSIAALEAMACGLPAVITKIGGADEMIIENENGLLCLPDKVDIGEKWNRALKLPFDKNIISQDIHQKFNHTDMVKKYVNVFTQL